jgi:acyl-CoA hydrolase
MPDLLDTRLENRWLVYPNHANNLGTVHGGYVMMWVNYPCVYDGACR